MLGQAHKLGLIVTVVSEPQITDIQKPTFFERSVSGHQEMINKVWTESMGDIIYLGEWHTHAEKLPTPSQLDRTEWNKLAVKNQLLPVLTVIVGTEGLHVELIRPDKYDVLVPLLNTFAE